MIADIYWLKEFPHGRIGTMARPRGGDWLEHEVVSWKTAGVGVVASALTDSEMRELDIQDEARFCKAQDIEFRRFPITDIGIPSSMPEWSLFIHSLKVAVVSGTPVVAHCRMGIGRASMLATSLMVSFGVDTAQAFQWMSEARGLAVPDTENQIDWVAKFAAYLVTRG